MLADSLLAQDCALVVCVFQRWLRVSLFAAFVINAPQIYTIAGFAQLMCARKIIFGVVLVVATRFVGLAKRQVEVLFLWSIWGASGVAMDAYSSPGSRFVLTAGETSCLYASVPFVGALHAMMIASGAMHVITAYAGVARSRVTKKFGGLII